VVGRRGPAADRGVAIARDPRVGLSGVAGGMSIVSGLFLGVLVGRWSWLPWGLVLLGALVLINAGGGYLRQPLLAVDAVVLGALSLPLMLNGSGVVLLIGCIFAVAALFYKPHPAGAAMPGWLIDRRHGRTPPDADPRQ
jgi:hypothetical protein